MQIIQNWQIYQVLSKYKVLPFCGLFDDRNNIQVLLIPDFLILFFTVITRQYLRVFVYYSYLNKTDNQNPDAVLERITSIRASTRPINNGNSGGESGENALELVEHERKRTLGSSDSMRIPLLSGTDKRVKKSFEAFLDNYTAEDIEDFQKVYGQYFQASLSQQMYENSLEAGVIIW